MNEVKVGDALIERIANHRALRFKNIDATKVMPKPERNLREVQAAATSSAVAPDIVPVWGWEVVHDLS